MTEFPALRDALVRAAVRRRRRRLRRVAGAAVPALALCAAAIAFAVVALAPERERERPAQPPRDRLEQAFGVFRQPQTVSDRLPPSAQVEGTIDSVQTRLLGQIGPVRVYAVPTRIRGRASLCLVMERPHEWKRTCDLVSRAVDERTPPVLTFGDRHALLLRDGSTDPQFIYADGSRGSAGVRNNIVLQQMASAPLAGTSWTGATGTRYVRRDRAALPAARLPGCPAALDPLPDDALDRGMRAALMAVDRVYPEATSARVAGAGEGAGDLSPCPALVGERSMIIGLRLEPRTAGGSRTPPEGRLLVGIVDGRAEVYLKLD